MIKRRPGILAAALVAAALAFAIPGQAAAAGPRTLTGAIVFRPYVDPQVAWSNYSLDVIYDTYIPLLTYRHAGGRAGSDVIPGLARGLPRISDGGRTYTLILRQGLRYSNGEPVRASDFKFAVERLFRISPYGPAFFFEDIVGARRFEVTAPRGGISGITTDDGTGKIVIHLGRPQRSFAAKLAMNWTAPVPPDTPERNLSNDPPPATGPYVITHSSPSGLTYARNPEWRRDGRLMPQIPGGHVGAIRIKVIRSVKKQVREVEQGKLDWAAEEMAPSELLALRHRFPSRVRLEPTLSTEYFWLNTRKAPFDDVRVRRAINYAVDRKVFSRLSAGQLSPSSEMLPPDLPGYGKYSLYRYDPAEARRLILAAEPSVRDVTVWTYHSDTGEQIQNAAYLVTVLDELGFHAHLRTLGIERYFDKIENPRQPHLDAGVSSYYVNYADPDDFFRETIGSRVTPYFNENSAQFFESSLNKRIERLQTEATIPAGGYAALDRSFMEQAPWVPIGNTRVPLFVSKRIDLGKVISNPNFGVDLTSLRVGG